MAEKEIEDEIVIADEPEIVVEGDEPDADAEPEKKPSDGSVDSSEDEAEEQRKKKRKRGGGNAQAKIKELWQREQDSKAEIARLNKINADTNAKVGKYQAIAVSNAEANLQSQKLRLQQELRLAHDVADSEKIAKISVDLSKVQADESELRRYKDEAYINGAAPPTAADAPTRAAKPEVSTLDDLYENGTASTRNWLDSNREWFDRESDVYDEEKATDVEDFARNLERKLAAQGRAEEVQTAAYYRRINEYIKENWSDTDDEEEDVAPVKKSFNRGGGGAAPVTSRAPNTKPAGQKKEIKMSVAERDFAVSLNLRHPNGTDYSDSEKIKAYVSNRT